VAGALVLIQGGESDTRCVAGAWQVGADLGPDRYRRMMAIGA